MERGPITFAQHGLGPPTPATAAAAAAAGGASREEAGSGGPAAMVPRRDSEGGEGFRVRAERCGAGAQRGPEAVEPEGKIAVGPTFHAGPTSSPRQTRLTRPKSVWMRMRPAQTTRPRKETKKKREKR